jgi:hypothetical protein
MILNNPKAPVRLAPRGEDDGPVYYLRVPTVFDRSEFRRGLARRKAQQWTALDLLDAFDTGLRRILHEPGDKKELDSLLNESAKFRENVAAFFEDWREGGLDELSPERQAKELDRTVMPPRLSAAAEAVADGHEPYQRMLADNLVYSERAGLVAAQLFLVGWEGVEVEFERGLGGVSDAMLEAVPVVDLIAIGAQVGRMIWPPRSRLKNSPSVSGRSGDQTRSTGTRTQRQKSRSPTTSGAVTSSELTNSASTH